MAHRKTQLSHMTCSVQVMSISQLIAKEFGGDRDLSGIGGVETGQDAAEFLLLGANSVQVNGLILMYTVEYTGRR